MCTSALPNRLPAHLCLVQLSRRRTAASAPRNPSPSAPPPASPSALCSMAHHLRSQCRSVNSAAAELESTVAEVDPAIADIKSAAAEVESRGGGAPISEGGGPRCFNRRRRSLNRRRFGGRREQPCPHRTLLLLPFVLHGLHSVRGRAYPQPRLDVCWIGYVSSTYRNFVFFLPILHGYVSTAYLMRIRIGYVSDTGYATTLPYRGIGADV